MALADYNGWKGFVREKRNKDFYAAQKEGAFSLFHACLGCGDTDNPHGVHSEEYGSTPEHYIAMCVPLCHRCHAIVHMRFKHPGVFSRYKRLISEEGHETIEPFQTLNAAFQHIFKKKQSSTLDTPASKSGTWLDTLSLTPYSGWDKLATIHDGLTHKPDPHVYGTLWKSLKGAVVDFGTTPSGITGTFIRDDHGFILFEEED